MYQRVDREHLTLEMFMQLYMEQNYTFLTLTVHIWEFLMTEFIKTKMQKKNADALDKIDKVLHSVYKSDNFPSASTK